MRNAFAIAALLLACSAFAAEDAKVLVVGTFHFGNPGRDYVKSEVPDVLTPERQKEIADVVARLKRFQPTKIAIEWPAENSDALDHRYAAYREGTYELTRSEGEQLGFRLARQLGHEKLFAIDVKGDMQLGAVMEQAQKSDPAFMAMFGRFMQEVIVPQQKMQVEKPIGETLRAINDPATVARGHGMYIAMAAVGDSIGAEQTSIWYARNIRIFANLARIAKPGDRVLVLYGSGHVAILQQLAREMPGMKVVAAADFL